MFSKNQQKYKIYIRIFFLLFMIFGISLSGVNGFLAGRRTEVPASMSIPTISSAEPSQISNLKEAKDKKNNHILREHIDLWKQVQKNVNNELFSAAFIAYQIGFASEEADWSLLSIKLFDEFLQDNPEFALARAWRGSAHAIYARNYPIRGGWQIAPGPGFVRFYHIWMAFSDLDAAVEAMPTDPVVRLVRASTYIGMPEIFGGNEIGIKDFMILERWTHNPDENPENADLLKSSEWRTQYFLNRGRSMERLKKVSEAKAAWQNLLRESNNIVDWELANWHLN
jgi:tetratricopeptide (TPR) repeat protein